MKPSKPPRQRGDEGPLQREDAADLSGRRQAEPASLESESRYRAMVEAFDGLIYICSPDYRLEFMNPRLIERTGYDGTGEYCYKVLHERNSICPWCVNERVFRGETVRWEVQSPKDNRWYYEVSTPIYHRDGRVSKQAVIQDITELKQAAEALRQTQAELERRVEERTAHLKQANEQLLREIEERQQIEDHLRESEARFLAFMQHLPAGAMIRNLQGRYLFANKAWEKAFAQKWQGKTWEDIWPMDTAWHMRELDQKVITTGEPLETLVPLEQEDGPHTWLINWFPILGQDGQPVLVGSVGIDITERLQAEVALYQEKEKYRILVEESPESWEKDIQEILGRLGHSADASRVYIFENHLNDAGDLLTSQRYEWAAPGIEPQIDNLEMQNISWREAGFDRWQEQLSQGQMIVGHAREFPPSEQELLASQEIKSIVVVPIFVGPQWWGMMGLDECLSEREWSPVELEALKTAAGTLGAAILHERAEQALRKSERKLRSLTAQLLTAQENERKRLAAELHDELGHALLTLKLSITSLEKQLTPEQIPLIQEFMKIRRFIGETIKEVRRLYLDLSPGDLEDLGLTEALRDMIEDVASLQKKVKWSVILDNLDGLFPLPVQTAIYRVVQEALTNIGKHAKAKNVSIVAKRESHRITTIIEDDGGGFEASKVLEAKRSLGLLTMEERVKILGGTFTLWSQKKQGTRISFTVPFPEEG